MNLVSLDPAENQSSEALRSFLEKCQEPARRFHRQQLVSISLEVDALDPLAVLGSIFESDERHFYVERPSENLAIAGAEAVLEYTASGPDRFEECQAFVDDVLANAIIVGDQGVPFSGPHFFAAFSFFNEVPADLAFPSASIFVPRWQVATKGSHTVAVANLVIDEDTDITAAAEKVWRAHSRFGGFSYTEKMFTSEGESPRIKLSEVSSGEHYRDSVQRMVDRIAAGEFDKIVLARAKDLVADEPMHPLRALDGLRKRFPECFAFSVANGRGPSFIGASPERLVRGYGGMLTTEALAGSAKRGETEEEDRELAEELLLSEKDRREHRLVLDSILRRIEPLGLQLSYPDKPQLRQLANVQHLHTPIKTAMPVGVRLLDVISRLHPTPAVGGVPRDAALAAIRSSERFSRGLYAGALGWLDSRGNGEFFVGLRSALIEGKQARLYAGAGIVAGSDPDKELAETQLKFKAMEEALFES